jgi:hypothetical protein
MGGNNLFKCRRFNSFCNQSIGNNQSEKIAQKENQGEFYRAFHVLLQLLLLADRTWIGMA